MNKEEFLYRIEEIYYSNGLDQFDDPLPGFNIKLELKKYKIIKRTKKGVWIKLFDCDFSNNKKFVLLGTRKKFAYLTKNEALESFRARKNKQIKILKNQLNNAEIALNLSDNIGIINNE